MTQAPTPPTPPTPPIPPPTPPAASSTPSTPSRYFVLARFGSMRQIATFATQIKNLGFGEKCILRTERGTEWGEVISAIEKNEETPAIRAEGTIMRRVTAKDYEHRRHIEEVEQPKEYTFCAAKIAERELPMQLVSVDHIFGGEKVIFYFMAEGRVDFRQLVKDLATEYKTRIELRQIGVRDEARLLAEYEHCGRELCCRTFIKDLEPVTMRMAKLQKTTLDPSKISGRCGRLMCCLRFEDEAYAELKSRLPKKGTRVRIADGIGDVFSTETLAQTVTVEFPERKLVTVKVTEILETLGEKPRDEQQQQQPRQGEDGDRRRPPRGRRDGDGQPPQDGEPRGRRPDGGQPRDDRPPRGERPDRRPNPPPQRPAPRPADRAPQPERPEPSRPQQQQPEPPQQQSEPQEPHLPEHLDDDGGPEGPTFVDEVTTGSMVVKDTPKPETPAVPQQNSVPDQPPPQQSSKSEPTQSAKPSQPPRTPDLGGNAAQRREHPDLEGVEELWDGPDDMEG